MTRRKSGLQRQAKLEVTHNHTCTRIHAHTPTVYMPSFGKMAVTWLCHVHVAANHRSVGVYALCLFLADVAKMVGPSQTSKKLLAPVRGLVSDGSPYTRGNICV